MSNVHLGSVFGNNYFKKSQNILEKRGKECGNCIAPPARCSENVKDAFWTFYVSSIYAVFPGVNPFKCQSHKMVKHTLHTLWLNNFVGLAQKELRWKQSTT